MVFCSQTKSLDLLSYRIPMSSSMLRMNTKLWRENRKYWKIWVLGNDLASKGYASKYVNQTFGFRTPIMLGKSNLHMVSSDHIMWALEWAWAEYIHKIKICKQIYTRKFSLCCPDYLGIILLSRIASNSHQSPECWIQTICSHSLKAYCLTYVYFSKMWINTFSLMFIFH